MTDAWPGALAIGLAYVSGSIPTAYLAGRWMKGIDLRTVGSGNLGTTNVYRELGAVPAIVVLVVDVLKGLLPVVLFPMLVAGRSSAPLADGWAIAVGAATVAGHAKPVFLLWRGGGKGVATAAGAFLALTPGPTALCVAVFAAVVGATRYVSLASVTATALLPVILWVSTGASPLFYASGAIAVFVAWGHRSNIRRLRAGTEPRIRLPGGAKA